MNGIRLLLPPPNLVQIVDDGFSSNTKGFVSNWDVGIKSGNEGRRNDDGGDSKEGERLLKKLVEVQEATVVSGEGRREVEIVERTVLLVRIP